MIVAIATKEATRQWETLKEQEEKARRDRRVRNTRLLLKNYRSFKLHVQDIEEELTQDSYVDIMQELEQDEFAVEAIRRSKRRTIAMVRFIEDMLEVYGKNCRESDSDLEMKKYETIMHLYVNDEKKTIKQVAECQKVEERTVYRNMKSATETLSVLVFGVDGLRLER